eukprot:2115274-Rhodomonas_salina.3
MQKSVNKNLPDASGNATVQELTESLHSWALYRTLVAHCQSELDVDNTKFRVWEFLRGDWRIGCSPTSRDVRPDMSTVHCI